MLDHRTSLAVETLLSLGNQEWTPPSPASSTDMDGMPCSRSPINSISSDHTDSLIDSDAEQKTVRERHLTLTFLLFTEDTPPALKRIAEIHCNTNF